MQKFVRGSSIRLQQVGPPLKLHNSCGEWIRRYSILSFLISGHLYADYKTISNMLGLPHFSHTQWHRQVKKLEPHVTKLAEWSCSKVKETIKEKGDQEKWVTSYDGFYQTRGHYSNNSSTTLHDYHTGNIAWFTHRTKRGPGHNWEGTSAAAEGDMLDDILGKAKAEGFHVAEIVADKDSSMNAIFCRHFPEGTIMYCLNHCSKTLHKDLMKIKQLKCGVSYP